MAIHRGMIRLGTGAPVEFVDITPTLKDWLRSNHHRDGILIVTSLHSTGRIVVNEKEPRLQEDMVAFLRRLAPAGAGHAHDRDTVDGRANAHAHLAALTMSFSETITVDRFEMELGQWQSVFFVELDGPRAERRVMLRFITDDVTL